MGPDLTVLNRIARKAMGPDVWAEGILAAIACGEPDDQIQREISRASEEERQALGKLIRDNLHAAGRLKTATGFEGGPFTKTVFTISA